MREGLRGVGEGARRDERVGLEARHLRRPLQLADGEAVAVGGGERDRRAVDLDADAGEGREGVVAAGGDGHLSHGGGEGDAGDRAGRTGHVGQRRVVVDRQRRQRERRPAAADLDPAALGRDRHRGGGEGAGDVGEQAARDEHRARLVDVGSHGHAAGDLVVEARQRETGGAGLDQKAREHRHGRAARQGAGRPGDGVGEDVALEPELHDYSQGRARRTAGWNDDVRAFYTGRARAVDRARSGRAGVDRGEAWPMLPRRTHSAQAAPRTRSSRTSPVPSRRPGSAGRRCDLAEVPAVRSAPPRPPREDAPAGPARTGSGPPVHRRGRGEGPGNVIYSTL